VPAVAGHSVRGPAAVGVEQPAKKIARVFGHQVELPRLEQDPPRVLLARAVLRQQARLVVAVALDLDRSGTGNPMVTIGEDGDHGLSARFDKAGPIGGAGDPDLRYAQTRRQVAVAEVEPSR
jgi:hypothetical protein